MKKALVLFTFLALLTCNFTCYADNGTPPPQSPPVKLTTSKNGSQHRAPSKVWIECYYSNGVISFVPSIEYNYLDVYVIDTISSEEYYGTVYDGCYTVLVDDDCGPLHIICTTDQGQVFEGYIY